MPRSGDAGHRQTGKPLLEVVGVSVRFGGVSALDGVSISVAPGEIHGLIGPNGAGKTTLLNVISRLTEPASGRVRIAGRDAMGVAAHRMAGLGLARTFQNLGLAEGRTVLQNLLTGAHCRSQTGLLDEMFRPWRSGAGDVALIERATRILDEVGLRGMGDATIGGLSYGHRKAVELARALMVEPRLLLLDEPTAGLGPEEMAALTTTILRLQRDAAVTVMIISHHMEFLMPIAHTVSVLDQGRHVASGRPDVIREHPTVISAYLGAGAAPDPSAP